MTSAQAYEWQPQRQYDYAKSQCQSARSALDKDECQYNTEKLVEALVDCIQQSHPYAQQCARMLPSAQKMHARANGDPVLKAHRQQQWDAQSAYHEEQYRLGPSGILNYPNPNRTCSPMPTGQYYCQ